MMARDNDIQYGTKDLLSDDEFEPRNIKMRISIMLDLDVVHAFRKQAKKTGGRYQTLINEALRRAAFGPETGETGRGSLESRVERIEAVIARVARGGLRAEDSARTGRRSTRKR